MREGERTRQPRKRRFSFVACRTRFDGQRLEIDGRMYLAAFLNLVMTAVCLGIVFAPDVPLPVRVLTGIGGLIVGYGFVDTCFGTCRLRFDTHTRALEVSRGNPFGKAEFAGTADGQLRVSRVRVRGRHAKRNRVAFYTVELQVELPDARVNFPLEGAGYSEEAADERVRHWERELGLARARDAG